MKEITIDNSITKVIIDYWNFIDSRKYPNLILLLKDSPFYRWSADEEILESFFHISMSPSKIHSATVTTRRNSGMYYYRISTPFKQSGKLVVTSKIPIDIPEYNKLDKKNPYWYADSPMNSELTQGLFRFYDKYNNFELEQINKIIQSKDLLFTPEQTMHIESKLRANEPYFRDLLLRTKFGSMIPISYLEKLAKRFNKQLRNDYIIKYNLLDLSPKKISSFRTFIKRTTPRHQDRILFCLSDILGSKKKRTAEADAKSKRQPKRPT